MKKMREMCRETLYINDICLSASEKFYVTATTLAERGKYMIYKPSLLWERREAICVCVKYVRRLKLLLWHSPFLSEKLSRREASEDILFPPILKWQCLSLSGRNVTDLKHMRDIYISLSLSLPCLSISSWLWRAFFSVPQ